MYLFLRIWFLFYWVPEIVLLAWDLTGLVNVFFGGGGGGVIFWLCCCCFCFAFCFCLHLDICNLCLHFPICGGELCSLFSCAAAYISNCYQVMKWVTTLVYLVSSPLFVGNITLKNMGAHHLTVLRENCVPFDMVRKLNILRSSS